MENIEERIKEMILKRVQKTGYELSSQKYEQEMTAPYKLYLIIIGKRDHIALYGKGKFK